MYSPKAPPVIGNVEELRQYVEDELRNVALEFSKTNVLWLNPLAREPDKPREGMVVYADGTNFNPGSGEGVYEYNGSAWVRPGPSPNTVSPYDFGAVGDGVADDTDAVVAALATEKHVDLRGGTFLSDSGLVMNDFQWMYNGKLIKSGAGDLIDMTAQQCALSHVLIDCNSTNGRGVIIDATGGLQRQLMYRTFITGSVGYALEFTEDGAGALFTCDDCVFARTNSALEAVKMPTDTSGAFPGRWFSNCHQGGNAFIELDGSRGTRILGGDSTLITWTANTIYTTIKNHRIAFAATVDGSGHIIGGCDIGGTLTLNGTDLLIGPNIHSGGSIVISDGVTESTIFVGDAVLTDNSSPGERSNLVYGHSQTSTPTWGSTGTTPAIGNGLIVGSASREGYNMRLRIVLAVGSTTTSGTGNWTFTFPAPFDIAPQNGIALGTAHYLDSSTGNEYHAVAKMSSGSAQITIPIADGTTNYWGATTPVTIGQNDVLTINIDFNVMN